MRALHLAQSINLVGGLDAFGDDADAEVVGEVENGLDNGQ